MALFRGSDDDQPSWPAPVQRLAGDDERRRRRVSGVVATGSMVCPGCDAPVAVPAGTGPADELGCPWCARHGAAREFLVLGEPTRPARVTVRVRPGRPALR